MVVRFNDSNAGNESSAGKESTAATSESWRDKVDAMTRYCAGEASAKFQQRPLNISRQPTMKDQGRHSVFGQYPPWSADPTVFI